MHCASFTTVLLLVGSLIAIVTASSVCSSGIYALLSPLDTYPPAESFCASKYPGTVTVTVTQSATMQKIRRATSSAATTTGKGKGTTTSKKSTTTASTTSKVTTSSVNAKASIFSSLQSQASAVVSTFCSCVGYPVVTTVCPRSMSSICKKAAVD